MSNQHLSHINIDLEASLMENTLINTNNVHLVPWTNLLKIVLKSVTTYLGIVMVTLY